MGRGGDRLLLGSVLATSQRMCNGQRMGHEIKLGRDWLRSCPERASLEEQGDPNRKRPEYYD